MDNSTTNNAGNKMNPTMIAGVVVVVAVVGLVFWMKTNNNASVQPAEVTTQTTEPTVEPTAEVTAPEENPTGEATDTSTVKTVTMEMGSFYYKPNVLTVKKGTKIKLILNAKDMIHNFNIDELNVKSPVVKGGNSATFEFTADKVGTFEYYCSIGKHRANGQIGTLTVQ